MHFVTGGAFNGKSAWVKDNYPGGEWISAYKGDSFIEDLERVSSSTIIVEGLEVWTNEILEKMALNQGRKYIVDVLDRWLEWENAISGRRLIVIGTDIMKGIVPIERKDRKWRDLTGWVYQDISSRCEQVDVIWYGINQTIKY